MLNALTMIAVNSSRVIRSFGQNAVLVFPFTIPFSAHHSISVLAHDASSKSVKPCSLLLFDVLSVTGTE